MSTTDTTSRLTKSKWLVRLVWGVRTAVGTSTLCPERSHRFSVLGRAIISQQVCTAVARTTREWLEMLLAQVRWIGTPLATWRSS